MADELARSNEFPFEQRIAEAVSMGIPIEEIAQHFSDSKDKSHKLWLQQYKGLQVAERARERTGQTVEPNPTAEQSTLAKAQKWAEENPITTAALATGAAGLAAGGAYAIKERIKTNAEIRKEKELAKIVTPAVQQQRDQLELANKKHDLAVKEFEAKQAALIKAETDKAIKTTKATQLATDFESKFNIPFAQAEQFSGGKITNSKDAEIIGNAMRSKLSPGVNAIPGTVSNQPAGVPNAVSPISQLTQQPPAPQLINPNAPAAPMQAAPPAGPQPSQFDLAQLGQSRDPLAGRGFQQPAVPPQAAPVASVTPEAAAPEAVAPPKSSVAQRTRRNAEQIAADREALIASAPEGRLPSAPNPKKSNKLLPSDVIGQGGWHWYQGQMGPEAEAAWLQQFGRTNQSYADVKQAMREGRLPGPVVPEGKQGGAFPREATVPNYIKGRASLGGILSTAAGAGLMATAGSQEGQEAMRRAASAIRDLGISPDMLMSKGEELGRLGNAYVNAGNQNYRAELQQQIAVEQDPKRLNQLIRELQKTGTVGGGRGVAPPSAYK